MAKTHSEAGMGFTAPSIGLIVCLFLVSTDAQGTQNNSTNGTDASVCTSGKGRNRIKCDEVTLLYRPFECSQSYRARALISHDDTEQFYKDQRRSNQHREIDHHSADSHSGTSVPGGPLSAVRGQLQRCAATRRSSILCCQIHRHVSPFTPLQHLLN